MRRRSARGRIKMFKQHLRGCRVTRMWLAVGARRLEKRASQCGGGRVKSGLTRDEIIVMCRAKGDWVSSVSLGRILDLGDDGMTSLSSGPKLTCRATAEARCGNVDERASLSGTCHLVRRA